MRRSCLALMFAPLLAACASLPEIDGGPGAAAAYPALMPIDAALAAVPPPPATDPAAVVAARAAALRARVAALRAAG